MFPISRSDSRPPTHLTRRLETVSRPLHPYLYIYSSFLEVHAAFTPLPMSVAGSRQCDRQTSLRLLACYRGATITSFYAMTVTANTFEIVSLLLDCADQIFLREAASRAQWASAC